MRVNDDEVLAQEGDVLYRVHRDFFIDTVTIIQIKQYPHCVYKDDHGYKYFNSTLQKSCFKTKEEAEMEVQKRKNILEKRRRLKEYELQLNDELNLKNHFIVK